MGCFPALSAALSLDAGHNQGRVKQRDLSLLQVQMSVQTQTWSCYRLFHYSSLGCLALRMKLESPKLLAFISVLNQKMFSDPHGEGPGDEETPSSIPSFWTLPNICLPSRRAVCLKSSPTSPSLASSWLPMK